MCTKVLSVGEGALTTGCFTDTYDGYTIEMCVCESTPGIYKPCNGAFRQTVSTTLFALIVSLILIRHSNIIIL